MNPRLGHKNTIHNKSRTISYNWFGIYVYRSAWLSIFPDGILVFFENATS